MMNGAVTIGTLDGANVEIRDRVGEENFFVFGATVAEARALREAYDPTAIARADADLTEVLTLLRSGHFNQFESGIFDDLIAGILSPSDPWLTVADFASFRQAHERAAAAFQDRERWLDMSIANTAASGHFSSDRSIAQYNSEIWGLQPITATATV
jgi:starch phosphorylase